jgi:hypothetical protein
MKTVSIAALTACCLALPAVAAPHVHGAASLQVAVDGNQLLLDFSSPLDNLVGFEHAPRTARQKQAWQQVQEKLRQPQTLFALPAAAACVPQPAQISNPAAMEAGGASHRHGGRDQHASLEASYSFQCAAPAALRTIEVKLFATFPRLRRLQVELVTPGGQRAARLTPADNLLRW